MKRRDFIRSASSLGVGASLGGLSLSSFGLPKEDEGVITANTRNISICTWGFSEANEKSGKALEEGVPALDAALLGVAVEEENIKNTTVGKGATPDREGRVTLDACVMNSEGNAGSVICVQNVVNVASLARRVMDDTPHVILAGEGAELFAQQQGYKRENLLTDESKAAYKKWLQTKKYEPIINVENHDTIAMLTMDSNGDLAGVCTTSGLAYKMMGRVGDSPIIGSGLFVDNEIGGAAATGLGEEVLKQVGSFLVVELMRGGMSPKDACREAVMRTVKKAKNIKDFQIGYIAINKAGETGCYSLQKGFAMMEFRDKINSRIESEYYLRQE